MPWAMPNITEQRKQFVIRANSEVECFTTLCRSFGISRATGYVWLRRYRECMSLRGVVEKTRAPHTTPQKTSAALEFRVLELRDRFGWGAKRLAGRLKMQNIRIASSTVHRIMKGAGRIGVRYMESTAWMVRVLVADNPISLLEADFHANEGLAILARFIRNGRPRDRKKAMVVIAHWKKVPSRIIADCLQIPTSTVVRYFHIFEAGGTAALFPRRVKRCADSSDERKAIFALLHSPPSLYSINRTSWRMEDLRRVLILSGHRISCNRIHRMIKAAGFRWQKARVVLTSSDPEYDFKVRTIKGVLSTLQADEAFFSIDEFGPFSVRQRGGRKRVGPGETFVVPQRQKSKGWLIVTAALELSRNQITHFRSFRKNTDEMIRMADILRTEYRNCSTIYLSWDAASWHTSKKLSRHIETVNKLSNEDGLPVVKVVPLPSCSQFLNVIESVFSGLARAVIHNSDYGSVEDAMCAIDRHFAERNDHFRASPRRAGQKIWGSERAPSEFSEGNNCKDPRY